MNLYTKMKVKKLPKLICEELLDFHSQIKELEKEREELIKETCKNCKHPAEAVRERPYTKFWDNSSPPWLICTECGLTEEGWYCGYNILKHAQYENPKKISHDDWHKMATLVIDNKGKKTIF